VRHTKKAKNAAQLVFDSTFGGHTCATIGLGCICLSTTLTGGPMPNNPDIKDTGRQQHIQDTGEKDVTYLRGYEAILQRKDENLKRLRKSRLL
jgi:hypothetical protein